MYFVRMYYTICKVIEISTVQIIYSIKYILYQVYGVLYYTHKLVNLMKKYWKIKDPENGTGSAQVSFASGTRSRIIDKVLDLCEFWLN